MCMSGYSLLGDQTSLHVITGWALVYLVYVSLVPFQGGKGPGIHYVRFGTYTVHHVTCLA